MSRRILVEDDTAILNNLSYLLREQGYVVAEAGDGEHAFKLNEEDRFDLVLSEVVMPGANGLMSWTESVLFHRARQCSDERRL